MRYEDALKESLKYFDDSEIEATTFLNKYALKDEDNFIEATPDDMHRRLAKEFSRIEERYENPLSYEEIYNLLKHFRFAIPQGSVMAGAGNPYQLMSVSNCFVVGNESDSYGGILRTDEQLVQLMKRRAGVGIDISHLRPEGSKVNNAAHTSTGAVSFMHRYSNSTREVAQGGRRGALMITIDIRHPDVEKFIEIKSDTTSVTGANISIRMRDDFMEAVRNSSSYMLRYPIDAEPGFGEYEKEVFAPELYEKLIKNAHKFAEPGVLFWDRILEESPAGCYEGFEERSTNPCGELPLCLFDSCRLLALNLYSFVVNPFTKDAYFDFEGFKVVTEKAQRLMDDVVDVEIEQVTKILEKIQNDPEPDEVKRAEADLWTKILEKAIGGRRTGLGVTALGDTFATLGIRYGSVESRTIADDVFRTFKLSAYRSSVQLAKERGCFNLWDYEVEKDNPFLARIAVQDPELYSDMLKYGRRNISLLTIAPTGTVSLMARTTSGIENLFKPWYTRRRKINTNDGNTRVDFVDEVGDSWQEFFVLHPKFEEYIKTTYGEDTLKEVINSETELKNIFNHSPYKGATVEDVDWVEKVKLQGVIQKHIDHSISVTTNLPEDIDVDTVSKVYFESWEAGCKGCTIYREGSRSGVLITKKDKIFHTTPPKRPKQLPCNIHRIRYSGDNWKILIGFYEDDPYEVFAFCTGGGTGNHVRFTDKDGHSVDTGIIVKRDSGLYDLTSEDGNLIIEDISSKSPNDEVRALTRLISTALRHGAPLQFIVEQLEKSDGTIVSFSRSVLRALGDYVERELVLDCCDAPQPVMSEGCIKCGNCGYSKCG